MINNNELEKNISLEKFTTFKTGGLARFFAKIDNIENLLECLQAAQKSKMPVFVLGAGSNILINDEGYDGLVLKVANKKLEINDNQNGTFDIVVGAGWGLNNLINVLTEKSISSIEKLFGIPGTIGGSIRGNAGVNDFEIKDVIKKVYNIDWLKFNNYNFEIKDYNFNDCAFGYRDSIFKRKQNIIWEAVISGVACDKNILKEISQTIITKRINSQPYDLPNAGSIFKNPSLEEFDFTKINPAELFVVENKGQKQVPAGWLIDQCGLKGYSINGAKVSEKHANFIVNFDHAKSIDIYNLVNFVKDKVFDKFKISLTEEIQMIGF